MQISTRSPPIAWRRSPKYVTTLGNQTRELRSAWPVANTTFWALIRVAPFLDPSRAPFDIFGQLEAP